jgi:prevent-host-death family protein
MAMGLAFSGRSASNKDKLGQLADEVTRGGPVIVTRPGRALTVLSSADEYERLVDERGQRHRAVEATALRTQHVFAHRRRLV